MRSSSVRCSDTAEGSCAHSGRAVLMAIRVSCPFVVGGRAGSPRVALHVAPWPGSPDRTARLSLALHRIGGTSGHRHLRWPRMEERVWWTRLRWRLRGATMWPAFMLALVVDTVLLRALPIAGDSAPDVFAAALLAFFFNLVVVAVGAPLAGRLVRRRWPALPKVVADDRAGTFMIAGVTAVLLAIGVVHHPVVTAR